MSSVTNIVRIPQLRRQLLITFGLIAVYRLGFHVFIPGVDTAAVKRALESGQAGGFASVLGFAGAITGGALTEATLFSLGIMPYISASIIFSLLVKVLPQLEALSKEGEAGRKLINQYTRYATIALCVIQSMFVVGYLRSGGGGGGNLILPQYRDSFFFYLSTVVSLTTGSLFLMWLGEMITEFGVGNGISLIIMAGIIARMPFALGRFVEEEIVRPASESDARLHITLGAGKLLFFLALFVAVIVAVVITQQSQRRIPIQQAKHTRGRRVYGGQRHYLPFRINASGVMPVIFANSLLILPVAMLQYVGLNIGSSFRAERGFWYISLTIVLIYFFTYFWMSLQFNPIEMANNMKEYGSFVPGIRPGRKTAEYLEEIMNRMTLVDASFLVVITIVGTGILIVVGVALDIVQKVESHLLMRHYEGFIKRGKIKARRGGTD
ncbi:MAG TPA: preprotein translocase subunit SecY [Planctomycetota bacterium]|nr:preprotein translocase subunit SecY [Planctomycetota bacterium]